MYMTAGNLFETHPTGWQVYLDGKRSELEETAAKLAEAEAALAEAAAVEEEIFVDDAQYLLGRAILKICLVQLLGYVLKARKILDQRVEDGISAFIGQARNPATHLQAFAT